MSTITEDSTPPASPSVLSPTGPVSVNATTTTLAGTAEAGSLVQVYADTNGDGMADDGEQVVGSEQLAPGQTSYSITVALAPNSPNRFLVTATDAAGNSSTAVVSPTITEDSIAPVVPSVSGMAGPIVVNTSTTAITGTAEAGSLVKVYADTNGDGVIDAGDQVAGTEQLAPGQTSYSITVPVPAGTASHFLVVATDAAGNVSSVFSVPTIVQNSTPPRITSVSRYGYHTHPTFLVLSFQGQMNAVRVQDVANYRILDAHGHAIRITSVVYDPTTNSATITPASKLNVHRTYELTVSGTGVSGLSDMAGNMLDGGNFTAKINFSTVAGQSPLSPTATAHAALDSILAHGVRVHKTRAVHHGRR